MIKSGMKILLVGLLLAISACKVELYSGLSQRDANEMLSVLLPGGVEVEKIPGKENTVTLMVEEAQQERAIKLLMARGLPRVKTANIGDVFNKDGLISSPTEERARFIYAMSEEISGTLSELDGVISIRVHVVLPKSKGTGRNKELTPASAAIFIKHQEEIDLREMKADIQALAANSIEGLSPQKVSVFFFPSATVELPPVETKNDGVLANFLDNQMAVMSVIGILLALTLILVASTVTLLLRGRGQEPEEAPAE